MELAALSNGAADSGGSPAAVLPPHAPLLHPAVGAPRCTGSMGHSKLHTNARRGCIGMLQRASSASPSPLQILPASCLRGSGLVLPPDFRDAVVKESGEFILENGSGEQWNCSITRKAQVHSALAACWCHARSVVPSARQCAATHAQLAPRSAAPAVLAAVQLNETGILLAMPQTFRRLHPFPPDCSSVLTT